MGEGDAHDQPAIDDARQCHRRDERRHAKHGDADAVERADRRARGDGRDACKRRHRIAAGHEGCAQDAPERCDRTDRKIEPLAARRDDDRLAKAEEAEERRDLELVRDLAEADEARQKDLPRDEQKQREGEQQGGAPEADLCHATATRFCSRTMKPSAATITRPLKNSCQMLGIPAK